MGSLKKRVKKSLKIFVAAILLLFIVLYIAFVNFSQPLSSKKALKRFKDSALKPIVEYRTYNTFKYRTIFVNSNKQLPTLVFVHGTIGSGIDFTAYMKDADLQKKFNMLAYDRVGYNYCDQNHVQESIAFERDLLDNLISRFAAERTIVVGYSYGGPIALATRRKVKKIVLLAPAVYSEVEPMPWAVNFYKWPLTRWLIPRVWKEASKEKISHPLDLKKFEYNWKKSSNTVLSIHGSADRIVPYSNSVFLEKQFLKQQFKLITVPRTGHDLLWSRFPLIKQQLLMLYN
ncbi:MAG: alpha/beta fold hydrolase [Tenacibaculum sp.]